MSNFNFEKIIKTINDKFECEAIVLFGSYARNMQTEKSDIDLAIKCKAPVEKKELFMLAQELEEIAKKDIDLINLDDINDSFRYDILMTGELLYCENQYQFELYKLDMFREYLELNESRMAIINNIKNGGKIYGE